MPTTQTGIATDFISFSRASLATVTDSDGKIKWAPHNLLINSEQFNASSWNRPNATVTANQSLAPNGTITADRAAEVTATATPNVYQVVSVNPAGTYAFGCAVKKDTQRYAIVSFAQNGGAYTAACIDLDTGVITKSGVSAGMTAPFAPTSTPLGNGWYLVTVYGTATSILNSAAVQPSNSDNPTFGAFGDYSYAGNAANAIFIWGAHLYRSDLGGMQNNPSAFPTYNPTSVKNLAPDTTTFTSWYKQYSTVTQPGAIAPDGLPTAAKITSVAASATHGIFIQRSSVSPTVPYTWSAYVKYDPVSAHRYIRFAFVTGGGSNSVYVDFDLLNGVIINKGPYGSATQTAETVSSVGNGWYRISVTGTLPSVGGDYYVTVYFRNSASNANPESSISYNSTGGESFYFWGAQLSDSASLDPYVPNYGAAPTSAAYYGPRRDFDAFGSCKGLLVEEQRTNLLLHSAAFDNIAWTVRGSVLANSAIAPDGTQSADKLLERAASGDQLVFNSAGITLAAGSYTASAFMKAAERGFGYIQIAVDNAAKRYGVTVNLSSGEVTSTSSTGGVTGTSSTVVNAGNGWWRVSVTANHSVNVAYIVLSPADSATPTYDAEGEPTYQGIATSGIYIWGAQLEAGAFATSYIPTSASQVTRSADFVSVNTQAFAHSNSESSLVAEGSISNGGRYVGLYGGGSDQIELLQTPTDVNGFVFATSGGTQADVKVTGAPFVLRKAGIAYKTNDFALSVNGGTPAADATVAIPQTSIMRMNANFATIYGAGHIRQITYLPRRISNADLQTRTA